MPIRGRKRPDDAKPVYRALFERRGTAASDLAARKQLTSLLMGDGDKEEAARLVAEVLEAE